MKAWPASVPPPAAWRCPPGPPRPPLLARGRAASLSSALKPMSTPRPLQGSMNQHLRIEPVPFIDVAAQRRRLGRSIDEAIARVLGHCQFILGPEVRVLEGELAAFCGARHVVSCASGTDALVLVLMATEIGPGDAVICPSFTFTATAEAVVLV